MHRHIGNFAAHEFHIILNKIIYFGGKFYIWIESIFHHLFESEKHIWGFHDKKFPIVLKVKSIWKMPKKCNAKIECMSIKKRKCYNHLYILKIA